MTSPLAPLPGHTLLGATHDVDARFPRPIARSTPREAWLDSRLYGIGFYLPTAAATVTSAPELEVWRHRDGGAA